MSKRYSAFHCSLFQSSAKKAPKCSASENETLSSHKAGRCISLGEDPERIEKHVLVLQAAGEQGLGPAAPSGGVMEALEGIFTSILRASLTVFPPQSPGGGQGRCPQAARGCYANTLGNTVGFDNLSVLLRQTIKRFFTR